jgi:hypothetical protein
LFIQLAQAIGDFPSVLSGDLVSRNFRIDGSEAKIPAGQALDILPDAMQRADESLHDQPGCEAHGCEQKEKPNGVQGIGVAMKR